MSDYPSLLKARINALVVLDGRSPKIIAESAGISHSMLFRYTTGENVPSVENLARLALTLGTTPSALLSEDESKPIQMRPAPAISDSLRSEILKIAREAAENAVLNRDQIVLGKLHEERIPPPRDPLVDKVAILAAMPISRKHLEGFIRDVLPGLIENEGKSSDELLDELHRDTFGKEEVTRKRKKTHSGNDNSA